MATINKEGFAEALALNTALKEDLSKKATKEFVEDIFSMIIEAVSVGDTVSIAGFGKFEPFTLANGKVTPKFRPFKDFQESVAA